MQEVRTSVTQQELLGPTQGGMEYSSGARYPTRKSVIYFYFSNTGFPSGSFSETIRRCANALVNTNGGVIVFGVNSSGIIRGMRKVSRNQEDLFRLALDREIRNFTPTVGPSLYRFSLIPIKDSHNNVMEIRISAGPVGEMFMTGDQKVFIVKNKLLYGPILPQEIKYLVIKKYKEYYAGRLYGTKPYHEEIYAHQALITPRLLQSEEKES